MKFPYIENVGEDDDRYKVCENLDLGFGSGLCRVASGLGGG
jgi:hypothetical protein